MEENKINKSIAFSIVAILLLVIVVAGATYAYFRAVGQTEEQEVTTANLTMGFEEGEWINTAGLMPISDAEITTGGAAELPFTVTNTGDEHMNITVSLSDITITDGLKDIDFRWGLFNTTTGNAVSRGVFSDIGSATEVTLLTDTVIDATDSETKNAKNYTLRIWIHDDGAAQDSLMGQSLKAKVKVTGEAVKYTPEECFTFNSDTGEIYGSYDFDNMKPSYGYDVSNPNCPTDIVVPKTINGVAVTKISDWAFGGWEILGQGVQATSIIIPESVTNIGSGLNGNNFSNITIPESVTSLDWRTFGDMNLSNLYLPDTISSIALVDENTAFYNSTFNINTFVIPNGVTTIGNSVFSGSYKLSSVVIPEGVTTIGTSAFSDTQIKIVEIPSSVTTIESDALGYAITEIVVRGKDSLDDFTDSSGLTEYADIIEFRP